MTCCPTMKPRKARTSTQPVTLKQAIRAVAHEVEGQGDGIEMVLIRMDAIEAAVREWIRTKRERKIRRKTA